MDITNDTATRAALEAERRYLLGLLCVTNSKQFWNWGPTQSARLKVLDAILDAR